MMIRSTCVSLVLGVVLFMCGRVTGQDDSTYLDYDRLAWLDINEAVKEELETKVISGSRVEENLHDVPFTIFVITAEEIKRNGYVTLTDALKHLPGIRVSQPGSGQEGETFLMRGLLGNSYAKILINDVPIKPFVVRGMPIGHQLPIALAERIEVIYGPAATLYGADASSGIINIILKDSEYPTHAEAHVDRGDNGYSRVNVHFGGKLAVGDDVMKLLIYGGFTSFRDRDVKYDLDSLYNPRLYERFFGFTDDNDVNYEDRSNYIGSPEAPRLENLPHASNFLGADLKFKNFHFSAQRFFRRDHSSIGLNPLAVTYAIPLTNFGETINTINLSYGDQFKNWGYNVNGGILNYDVESTSSYGYVIPAFGGLMYALFDPDNFTPDEIDGIHTFIDDFYFKNVRFSKSNSREYFGEILLNFKINKNLSLNSGINYRTGSGLPIEHYLSSPFSDNNISALDRDRFDIEEVSFDEISAFSELSLAWNKIRFTVGSQILKRSDDYLTSQDAIVNPRVGFLYKIRQSLSLRGSVSRAFRYPSPFFTSSTYTIVQNNIAEIKTGSPDLTPENTLNYELGIRYAKSKINMDASLYYMKTTDFINYSLSLASNEFVSVGYFNEEESYAEMLGFQTRVSAFNIVPSIGLDAVLNFNYSVSEERVRGISFAEQAQLISLPELRAQPKWMIQWRLRSKLTSKLSLTIDQIYMSSSLTRNAFRVPTGVVDVLTDRGLDVPGYYTVDARLDFDINEKLSVLLRLDNVLNTKFAGIDAVDNPDALLYNPQSLRYFRFGASFKLN